MADKIDKLAEAVDKLTDVVQREAGLDAEERTTNAEERRINAEERKINAEERKINARERKVNGEFREDVIAFQNETRDNFEALTNKVETNRFLLTQGRSRADDFESRIQRIESHLGFGKDPN